MTHGLPVVLAVLGALAVPAAAHAGTAEVRDGKLTYTARNAEVNVVDVRVAPSGKLLVADSAPQLAGAGCLLNGSGDLECDAAGVTSIELTLADRNDVVRYRAPHAGRIDAGIGTDTFFGGLRQGVAGPVSYIGGDGLADALRYSEADRGVVVSLGASANDGRPGDLEDARGDIEVLEGSRFDDTLTGTDDALGEVFLGGNGIDQIDARGGPDRIDERTTINGADTIDGGSGRDMIDYGRRDLGVAVSLDGVANDGEVRPAPVGVIENDNIKPTVEDIITTRATDFVVGSVFGNDIRTGGARDFVRGSELRPGQVDVEGDTLDPGAGDDQVSGSNENDVFFTRDGDNDDLFCAGGLDFATTDVLDPDRSNGTFDGSDHVAQCEAVDAPVGALELAPKVLRGGASQLGPTSRPTQAWRELGTITERLAGERLALEVEATDRRGRRRLERG